MSDGDWAPPTRTMQDGVLIFDSWRPIRDAIDASYRARGLEPPRSVPKDEWNMVGLAIHFHDHAGRATCVNCRSKLWNYQTIRCLDCKAALCEQCAPKHFWPNGRPK